jgi:hypothetical protein
MVKGLKRRPAQWTHEYQPSAGHLYYFAPDVRREPPYYRQRDVKAIIDIAHDGTLAGVGCVQWNATYSRWECSPNEASEYDPEACEVSHWMPLPEPPRTK